MLLRNFNNIGKSFTVNDDVLANKIDDVIANNSDSLNVIDNYSIGGISSKVVSDATTPITLYPPIGIAGTNYADTSGVVVPNNFADQTQTNFAEEQNYSNFAQQVNQTADKIGIGGYLLGQQNLFNTTTDTPSSIVTEANVKDSSNSNRYNEASCYIRANTAILNKYEATRFLNDFINTKTIKVRFMEDLGIAKNVKSVSYIKDFFDYKGVSIRQISINASNDKVMEDRFVLRDFHGTPNNYISGYRDIWLSAFNFGGHFLQEGTNLTITTKYTDKDKFLELINN